MNGWLNTITAAEYAAVSEPTISKWLKQGLKHCRLGRNLVRIKPEWVDEFMLQHLVEDDHESIVDELLAKFDRG